MYSSESLRRSYIINDRYLGMWNGKKVYISNKENYTPRREDENYYVLYDYDNVFVCKNMVCGYLRKDGEVVTCKPYEIPYLTAKEPKVEKAKSAEIRETEVVETYSQPSPQNFSFSGLEDLEKEMEKLIVGLERSFDKVVVDF